MIRNFIFSFSLILMTYWIEHSNCFLILNKSGNIYDFKRFEIDTHTVKRKLCPFITEKFFQLRERQNDDEFSDPEIPKKNPYMKDSQTDFFQNDNIEKKVVIDRIIEKLLVKDILTWTPEELSELIPHLLNQDADKINGMERYTLDYAIKNRLTTLNDEEQDQLLAAQSFIEGFKKSEVQRLARKWIQDILQAVTEGIEPMNEVIFKLINTEEGKGLCDPVLDLLDSMIKQAKNKSPDEETHLQMVLSAAHQRVKAELDTKDKWEMRLLGRCITLENEEKIKELLTKEIVKREDLEHFLMFVGDGINYIQKSMVGPSKLHANVPSKMKLILDLAESMKE